MKYLKTYEEQVVPEVGDYVVVKSRLKTWNGLCIGKITSKYGYNGYFIKYKLPDLGYLNGNVFNDMFYYNDILFFSKDKKELEKYMDADKYNL